MFLSISGSVEAGGTLVFRSGYFYACQPPQKPAHSGEFGCSTPRHRPTVALVTLMTSRRRGPASGNVSRGCVARSEKPRRTSIRPSATAKKRSEPRLFSESRSAGMTPEPESGHHPQPVV
jgi:hypothetical protein